MFLSYTLCYNHQMLSVVSFGSLPSLPPSFSLEVSFCPEYSVNQSSLLLLQTPAPPPCFYHADLKKQALQLKTILKDHSQEVNQLHTRIKYCRQMANDTKSKSE